MSERACFSVISRPKKFRWAIKLDSTSKSSTLMWSAEQILPSPTPVTKIQLSSYFAEWLFSLRLVLCAGDPDKSYVAPTLLECRAKLEG